MAKATFSIWRGEKTAGKHVDYTAEVSEGMVVLDAVHQIQATQANDLACRWNCKAGKCGSCSAEINGMPKLMCMTRLDELDLSRPVTIEPMRAFPPIRDLVTDVSWNFRVKMQIKPFKPRKPDRPDGTWTIAQEDIDRVQEFRKCIECFLCQDVLPCPARSPQVRAIHRPALLRLYRGPGDAPAGYGGPPAGTEEVAGRGPLQHHQMLHQGLPGAYHDHR